MVTSENKEVIECFLGKIEEIRPHLSSIYLFGSRARGKAGPNSDYDLLVILPRKNQQIKDQLYEASVDVYMEKGADISLKIIQQKDFDRMNKLSAPFIENILRDGEKVG